MNAEEIKTELFNSFGEFCDAISGQYQNAFLTERHKEILRTVYGALWVEAYYDPETEAIGNFCKPLANLMAELNQDLKFKQ